MSTNQLGQLLAVDLRSVWNNEATDFTPWLAEEENLALLGETIGLELELVKVEKDVGPYRADIVCKDTVSEAVVLIENQLEKTDHNHLGQLLTYSAGLDAVAIVWIADRFTEDHRAALDWLNDLTPTEVNFFGLEIELWQIGASKIAPKFNVVSKPNEWTKTISGRGGPELTDRQKEHLSYWTGLLEHIKENSSHLRTRSPRPTYALRFPIGRSGFRIEAFRHSRDRWIGVILVLGGEDAKAHYYLLEEQKRDIEDQIGESLEWMEKPGIQRSQIALRWQGEDPTKQDQWPEQFVWLREKIESFQKVFSPKIQELDAADYIDAEDEQMEI